MCYSDSVQGRGINESDLETLQNELEVKLADRHPKEVGMLLQRIIDTEAACCSGQACIEGVRGIIAWSESELACFLENLKAGKEPAQVG